MLRYFRRSTHSIIQIIEIHFISIQGDRSDFHQGNRLGPFFRMMNICRTPYFASVKFCTPKIFWMFTDLLRETFRFSRTECRQKQISILKKNGRSNFSSDKLTQANLHNRHPCDVPLSLWRIRCSLGSEMLLVIRYWPHLSSYICHNVSYIIYSVLSSHEWRTWFTWDDWAWWL